MFDQTNPEPLIYTSKGNLPLSSLRAQTVWSPVEVKLATAKAALLAKVAALEAACDQFQFHAAMQELKAQAMIFAGLDEIYCWVEHYQGDELVRRECNLWKLTGEAAQGEVAVMA